ncbi:MAG: hypothetical protein IPM32_12700 [Ignavibacteriae bacterium]|nr:hypothetical protein [Ignavibacteriota bacterium]
MKYNYYLLYIILIPISFLSCTNKKTNEVKIEKEFKINESFQTSANELDNVDSPTFYKLNDTTIWLITTAKSTDRLLVHDASNGKFIKYVGTKGNGQLQFLRPNGIFVIDSLLFIVERDNARIQVLQLPQFEFVTFVGNGNLIKPYGIFVYYENESYNIYVTDNYETADEQIPIDSELGNRIHFYKLQFDKDEAKTELIKKFGETNSNGVLRIVESINGDLENNNLLIAEEKEDETCIKVYNFNGDFKNKVVGLKLFKSQVEGIALYKKNNNGFWIVTDQDSSANIFHLFERKTFNHIGYFKSDNTKNTDGIWLTQESYTNFPQGAFFAVNNDKNISGFNLKDILDKL